MKSVDPRQLHPDDLADNCLSAGLPLFALNHLLQRTIANSVLLYFSSGNDQNWPIYTTELDTGRVHPWVGLSRVSVKNV